VALVDGVRSYVLTGAPILTTDDVPDAEAALALALALAKGLAGR
jgi:hypothetical protein